MRIYRIIGIAVITGKDVDLNKVDRLVKGTHHIARNPPKGIPRPRKVNYPIPEEGNV